MRLFYQSLGVTPPLGERPLRAEAAGDPARAPRRRAPTIEVHGLSPGRAIADQYRYLEYLDTGEILDNGLRGRARGL